MFEHVGRPQYPTYFRRVHDLLKPDGTALIHSIGRLSPPGTGNAWIRKYIFPGGYIPAASEALAVLEESGLLLNAFEVWRLHSAKTLRQWNHRFRTSRPSFVDKRGESFSRLWEYYFHIGGACGWYREC